MQDGATLSKHTFDPLRDLCAIDRVEHARGERHGDVARRSAGHVRHLPLWHVRSYAQFIAHQPFFAAVVGRHFDIFDGRARVVAPANWCAERYRSDYETRTYD